MNIAFIPVRGGSKSIPLKNIKEINGKPLVYWTLRAANNAKCIDKVVIATDSGKIKEVVSGFGFEKLEIFDRNSENASDTASTESVMVEYLTRSNVNDGDKFFLIQATSPLLRSEHIEGMYEKYLSCGADSIFSGVVEKQFKWFIKPSGEVTPINYDYRNRPRRQDFEGVVAETGACYINSVANILRDKCRLSGKITFYELPAYTAYELDEEADWLIVEELLKIYS